MTSKIITLSTTNIYSQTSQRVNFVSVDIITRNGLMKQTSNQLLLFSNNKESWLSQVSIAGIDDDLWFFDQPIIGKWDLHK